LSGRLPVKKLWSRFEEAWSELTPKQKKAVDVLFMNEERPTLEKAALKLGISIASLRDRVTGATKKLREAFPEFALLHPSRTHTALSKRPVIFDGLYRRKSAQTVHPLIRVRQAGHLELRETLPVSEGQKPQRREVDPIIAKWLNEYRLKAEFVEKIDEPKDRNYERETEESDSEEHEPGQPRTKRLYEVYK
ncbi:MAG: hypothetical protein ACXVB1_13345, partial [Pseudobdellovibrionaceae bacterium]